MKRALLLAYPAGHSLSPAMHNAAFAHLGVAASYQALEVPPAGLAAAVDALRRPEVLGANVTIPHKLAVAPLLDLLSPAAQTLAAVNTIVPRRGRLQGHNTDVRGFLRAVAELGLALPRQRALVLGAGGAAHAVVYALLTAGVAELAVHNRTAARAQALAERLGSVGEVVVVERRALPQALEAATLLVNTTSVGMLRGGADPDLSPLPDDLLPRSGAVVDIVYRPAQTRLLRRAEAAGLTTQNGIPMLLYQGVEALELWLEQPAPVAVMRAALMAALAE